MATNFRFKQKYELILKTQFVYLSYYIAIKLLVTLLLTGIGQVLIVAGSTVPGKNWDGQMAVEVDGKWSAETIFIVSEVPHSR